MLFGMKLRSRLQRHMLGSLRIWNTVISAQKPDAALDAAVHPTRCLRRQSDVSVGLLWESSERQALHSCLLAGAQKRAAMAPSTTKM